MRQVIIQNRQSMILQELMKLIASLLRVPCTNMGPKCPRTFSHHLGMNNALKAVGLDDIKDEAIAETLERLEKLVLPVADTSERLCDNYAHREAMHTRKAGEKFRQTLDAIRARQTGLCLDCVKGDRWDGKWTENCRNHMSSLARP